MIYYFGDSHTKGMEYFKPKDLNYTYEPYPYYLSQKIGMDYKNMAGVGNNLVNNVNILTDSLKELIDNAKIVVFQFQFFQNAFFRINDNNLQWKDFVLNPKIDIDMLLRETNITMEDSIVLLSYLDKFEEYRSWYEMQRVYSIFNFLESYGIKCYSLFWIKPNKINVIEDKRMIILDNNDPFVCSTNLEKISDETNGKWNDGHISNSENIRLAEKIHKFILNN